jgi:hypothetical protein
MGGNQKYANTQEIRWPCGFPAMASESCYEPSEQEFAGYYGT